MMTIKSTLTDAQQSRYNVIQAIATQKSMGEIREKFLALDMTGLRSDDLLWGTYFALADLIEEDM